MNSRKLKGSQYENSNNVLSYYCGIAIRKTRKNNGLTASQLGKELNISQQQMSRYERGINKITIDMLFNIAIALNISFESLIKSVLTELHTSNSDDVIILRKSITASDTTYFF
ncbi:MAG: helix-turn-helix transcriptional regulator [Providencia heimbachae]|nr:helix-turn-helix transcriptional regulator [Providencia heimbachae]